jgi:hypothetical protein
MENEVVLGFVEELKNKISMIQRRCYGPRDEDYLHHKIFTSALPPLPESETPGNHPRSSPESRFMLYDSWLLAFDGDQLRPCREEFISH